MMFIFLILFIFNFIFCDDSTGDSSKENSGDYKILKLEIETNDGIVFKGNSEATDRDFIFELPSDKHEEIDKSCSSFIYGLVDAKFFENKNNEVSLSRYIIFNNKDKGISAILNFLKINGGDKEVFNRGKSICTEGETWAELTCKDFCIIENAERPNNSFYIIGKDVVFLRDFGSKEKLNGDFNDVLRVVCADYFKNSEPTFDIKKEDKYFLCAYGVNTINNEKISEVLKKSSFLVSYKNDFFGAPSNFKKMRDSFKIIFNKNNLKITPVSDYEVDCEEDK
jgi:hypothetical protein